MKKIIAFAGSNHSNSINQHLARYAAEQTKGLDTEVIDLRDYDVPLYSIDLQKAQGIPEKIMALQHVLDSADGYIIASPEYNGMVPAFFKNIIDWLSRNERKFLGEKPVLLLSTAPGKNGGATNLQNLVKLLPWWGGAVVASYSLPFYGEAFLPEGNLKPEFQQALTAALNSLQTTLA